MEDSMEKIKTVKSITPTKNVVSIPFESISASINIFVESVCDRMPIESILLSLLRTLFLII